jgi:plastocyanin
MLRVDGSGGVRRQLKISAAAIGISVLVFAACSGDGSGSGMGGGMGNGGGHHAATQNAPKKAGQFRLDEWTITADATKLPSGSQTITALNTGHHTHELVIVKANSVTTLPTKSDGSVDEKALEAVTVGEIADVGAGSSKQATFTLDPGTYVAFCNISDAMGMGMGMGGMEHNHFDLGMHTTFTVGAA